MALPGQPKGHIKKEKNQKEKKGAVTHPSHSAPRLT